MKHFIFLFILVLAIIISTSCEKEESVQNNTSNINSQPSNEEPDTIEWNNNGLGLNYGYPTGTKYQLPKNVDLYNGLVYAKGFSLSNENQMRGSFQQYGSDGSFYMYMFLSTTLDDVVLKIPGGLIFYTPKDSSQNGFVIKDIYIPLERFNYIKIGVFCLNLNRRNNNEDKYIFGPKSNHPELSKIADIMNTKEDVYGNEILYDIQDIIWEITNRSGNLREEDIAYLESLT